MTQSNPAEISPTKPRGDNRVGWTRAIRRDVGALLEYVWHLSGSVRSHRVHALIVRGREKCTGSELTALYLGDRANYGFICKRAFSDFGIVESHHGVSALAAGKWIRRYADRVDLVILDVELLFCKMLLNEPFVRIPHWVRQKYRMPNTWEGVLKSLRKNTRKTDLRKVRKYGLIPRITRADEDFRDFYHRMHRPYLEKRFDDLVIIEPEWKFMRQCRKGELMQITRDDEVLGGVLMHKLGGRLAYVWVGVRDDLAPQWDRGVFSAMYYYTILHGYENGCEEVDFLGTRPVLSDGLFRYKRKWGTRVEDSPIPRGDILIRPVRFDAAVRAIFRENPFVVRDGPDLAGKILLDHGVATRGEIEDQVDRFYTPGLRRLKVLSTGGFEAAALGWAEAPETPLALFDLSASSDPAGDFCRF
jgi:hypothetical protein